MIGGVKRSQKSFLEQYKDACRLSLRRSVSRRGKGKWKPCGKLSQTLGAGGGGGGNDVSQRLQKSKS